MTATLVNRVTIVLLLNFTLFVSMSACAHELTSIQDHISVLGVGEVELEPDQATLRISVNAKQATLVEAKSLADERYRKVLGVIKDAGIEDKYIKATRVNAQPEYQWQNNRQVYKGERVSRSLNVIINDLDKVSLLMQALVENDVSTIEGIDTGFKDPKVLQKLALQAAAQDAKSKADFLAEQLGRSLGSAFLITEQNASAPRMLRQERTMMASAMEADTAPPPEMFGMQKVRVQISVKFALL
jgi:uncharacterized protein YggE